MQNAKVNNTQSTTVPKSDPIKVHTIPLYQAIARQFSRYQAFDNKKQLLADDALHNIRTLVRNYMPHGSGFDSGTEFDFDNSRPRSADKGLDSPTECLVFTFGYHHMDGNGYYCGWSYWTLTVFPSLEFGYDFTITPDDPDTTNLVDDEDFDLDMFRDYLTDTLDYALNQQVPMYAKKEAK